LRGDCCVIIAGYSDVKGMEDPAGILCDGLPWKGW
jgi:hypothetical protein